MLPTTYLGEPETAFEKLSPQKKTSRGKLQQSALATWIIDWPRSFCTSMACYTGLMKSKPSSNPSVSVENSIQLH